MNKKIKLTLIVLLLLGGLFWGLYYYQRSQNFISTDDAQIEGDLFPIIPKVSGYVSEVFVRDNQEVRKGDPLMNIESKDYQIHVEQAVALRQAARETLLSTQAQVGQIISQSEAANADYQKSLSDLRRYKLLAANDEISHQQLEEAERAASSNASKFRALEQQIAVTRAQVKLGEAKVVEAEAALNNAELELSYTHITSPASGKVSKKSVQPGQWVQMGQSLMAIVPLTDLWVVANFKETQTGRMRPGQKAEVRVDSYPGLLFHGRIDSIAAGTGARFSLLPPENATGNYVKVVQRVPVKIVLDESELKSHPEVILRSGLNVVATVALSGS
ncbi:MAG: HlyD family secretion protein [Nitrospirae bacterium]|nr:HlyD family secretion protein [Nitrospirota bacterium]MBI3594084.1 HlyD family secretion protein [Nitrospirota bacterium]